MTRHMVADACEKYAAELGAEHGKNAASWWEMDAIGGRASGNPAETARRVLQGLEDGDPVIYDAIPHADLSGEWAGDMTGPELVDYALAEAGVDSERHARLAEWVREWCFNDICDAYGAAFFEACEAEIVRACKAAL